VRLVQEAGQPRQSSGAVGSPRCRSGAVGAGRGTWHVDIWADYEARAAAAEAQRHDWALLLSVREKRSKALEDCDRWMTNISKKLRRAVSHNGRGN
jgi:hypothetical protein